MKSSNQLSRDLNQAQKKLADFLGEDMKDYYSLLKSWFRGKLSKNEFDLQARNLIPHDSTHLHNNFLLTLLTKCGTFDPSMDDTVMEGKAGRVKKKFKKSHAGDEEDEEILVNNNTTGFQRFIPADPFSHIPQIPNQAVPPKFREFSSKVSLSLLPTRPLIHCRLFVCAWERSMEGVTDECVELVFQAVRVFVKNIVQALASHKYGFQVHKSHPRCTSSSLDSFVHSIGVVPPAQSLLPSIPPSLFDLSSSCATDKNIFVRSEVESRKRLSQPLSSSHQVSLFDLLQLLQTRKKVIGSSSLCRLTEERIIHKLYHPCQQLMAADEAVKAVL